MSRSINSGNSRRADYGRGEYQIDAPDLMLTPEAMITHLRQTLVSPDYKPPLLPSIALELMKLTRQPGVSVAEVRKLLERDALLAAKVLQLAQSALYSRGSPVRSLHEAISLLGLRTLGDLFLQTVLSMRVFRADGYDRPMAMLMLHSMVTAHISRLACRMTSMPDEYAFMCGLLHDAGMAAGLLIFAEQHAARSSREAPRSMREGSRAAVQNSQPSPPRGASEPPSYDELAVALQAVHEEASAILAEAWKLNPDIRIVLGSHHQLRAGGRVHPLAAVVCVSDWIASEAGAGMGTESDGQQAAEAAKVLSFSRANLDELTIRAREIIELS
jgi:HD-like signal output (HDOD) protein